MKRTSNQVSLEPYGYRLVPRAPAKMSSIQVKVKTVDSTGIEPKAIPSKDVEPKGIVPSPSSTAGISPVTILAENTQPTAKKQNSNSMGCLVALGVVVVLFVFVVAATPHSAGTSNPTYMDSDYDAGMACVMAEKLVKPQLKAPSTAEFDYGDCKGSASHSGNTWTLHSYIDADNSFGAHILTYYHVQMSNTPPSDMWYMTNLQFDE